MEYFLDYKVIQIKYAKYENAFQKSVSAMKQCISEKSDLIYLCFIRLNKADAKIFVLKYY